jgi:hypothetical protein
LLFPSASDKKVEVRIAKLPVGGLPEGIVGRLAGPPEIEHDGPVAARQPHRLYPNSSQIQGANEEFNDQLRRIPPARVHPGKGRFTRATADIRLGRNPRVGPKGQSIDHKDTSSAML